MIAPVHRLGVLDLETIPCADAMGLTARPGAGHRRGALHRIVSASVLVADEGPDGFSNVDLRTFAAGEWQEPEILSFLDMLLPDPADPVTRLVTYGGTDADLRTLRLRLAANWMFDARSVAGWTSAANAQRHVDLLRQGFGARTLLWSLPDLCAGLGLPMREGILARSVASLVNEGRWDAVSEHNMMDVVGTFIAYASDRSIETGSEAYVATAWLQAAALLRNFVGVNRGRQRLSDHHFVGEARRRLSGAERIETGHAPVPACAAEPAPVRRQSPRSSSRERSSEARVERANARSMARMYSRST